MRRGDIVAVVETQKGAIEIDIFEDGVIERWLVEPGTTVPVGTPLALIAGGRPAAAVKAPEVPPIPAAPAPAAPPRVEPPPAAGRARASPAARRLASERGIALSGLSGSGPGGAILYADVERAAAGAAPGPALTKRLDLKEMRRAIAAAMARSKREIPHYYLSTTVDLTGALAWLEAANAARSPAQRLLLAALLLKAVARALGEAPEFNGFFTAEGFQPGSGIHIGTAIAIRGGGLVAPAIRDADKLPLDELMARLRDLVTRARSGALRSSELSDPTITVTNLGERGVETRVRRHLPAPGRARRLWHAGRAALGRRRGSCRSACADDNPRRRPPRQRRPSRGPLPCRYRPPTAEPGDAMTRDDITAVLIDELGRIAPETDASRLDPNAELREELDINSMDFLNLVTALTERLEIDIPEVDYPNLATFNHAVDYLAQRLAIAE